ncbi:tRNA (adenosine(37)-N6)-threonylcarbamoyltransferase complex transferase subunit TsaD [Flammeovirga kamogawensis]|uniref:tRNA N6-adenosine threonylcarbamoyltransferase n=1 Tax=Flammeovirga kamogawensis TaxID=373891 RepID=A0ABX8GVI7_9BACT|nr:tRNA (adenosine(37)-N6)-threonylcarbamoyltransferase complex transferase subunit TsaD [Flammeovirga kamogawensis]MBB6459986.1 N6-L-threonylcarbamoyladenine synthase [Flammeovirga kamogawensis]QWG06965.1 tRNA (adenosine(37)-N6)-threonylcarbamoyltransferase complex transferase subunit TsaD [Flammeovirga kamogawensis]TRX68785.1 tRNA (adenosine(37)-N6)-threonylcarbamoyltransferase complex transferase subunit TsaD [Flammeovirga kamogawensis]
MSGIILAIESSCDETSASVVKNGTVLSNIVSTQEVHQKYGGVVPELASRAHQKNILPVVSEALKDAGINKTDLDAVAFTKGPGLLGALLVGTSFAKGMAMALDIPLIGVNHMQAHILAHFIENPKPKFPFLCLTVSGGHTQLVVVKSPLDMEVIGETIDDAVGEAFDKTAKIMGLDYPGGPLIDKFAKDGDPLKFKFPNVNIPDYNFSFSGIKTAFLNFLRKETQKDADFIEKNKADLCASIQYTLIRILMKKLTKAANELNIKEIGIAGGVSANSGLRNTLKEEGNKMGWNVFIPEFEHCTDNAAMIAMAAHYQYEGKDFEKLSTSPNPRLKFTGSR